MTKIDHLLCSETHDHIWVQSTRCPRSFSQPMIDCSMDTKEGPIVENMHLWLKDSDNLAETVDQAGD